MHLSHHICYTTLITTLGIHWLHVGYALNPFFEYNKVLNEVKKLIKHVKLIVLKIE